MSPSSIAVTLFSDKDENFSYEKEFLKSLMNIKIFLLNKYHK